MPFDLHISFLSADSLSSALLVLGSKGTVDIDNKIIKVFERPCARMAEQTRLQIRRHQTGDRHTLDIPIRAHGLKPVFSLVIEMLRKALQIIKLSVP